MTTHPEEQYLDVLRRLLAEGRRKGDRTGTGTLQLFGVQTRWDLSDGFPLLTTKRVWWRAIVAELLWMLSGSTNAGELEAQGVDIWAEWGDPETRELGPVYGGLWRTWPAGDGRKVDQLRLLVEGIRVNPESRRHVMTTWHPDPEVQARMALPPCHGLVIQAEVTEGRLSLAVYQRSADAFLGLPFNIASYALLLHLLARATRYTPGELVHTVGDCHLYLNHVEQARLQVAREPRPLPTLRLAPRVRVPWEFRAEDIGLVGYEPHPPIPAPVAV